MYALVTGASGGIGRQMAGYLAYKGYDLILAARRTDRLNILKETLKTEAEIVGIDLASEENCISLYDDKNQSDSADY